MIKKCDLIGLSPNSKAIKAYKENLPFLNSCLRETMVGLLLGDASLQTLNKGKTFRVKFEWGSASANYLFHVYETFYAYCISEPHRKERISPKGNKVVNYGFQTLSSTNLNFLSEIFIYKPHKTLNLSLLKEIISPRSLAYWFMDDGGKYDYAQNSLNRSLVLNTQSFTISETKGLALILENKFNLKTEIRQNKGKWVILIKSESYPLFCKTVNPYMHESMKYKYCFGLRSRI